MLTRKIKKLIGARTKAINWQRADVPQDWVDAYNEALDEAEEFGGEPEVIDHMQWATEADRVIEALNTLSDNLETNFKALKDALAAYSSYDLLPILQRSLPSSDSMLPEAFQEIVNTINREAEG